MEEKDNSKTTIWVVEWIEDKNGEWGTHRRTICSECSGIGSSEFRYCPWCGKKAKGKRVRKIFVEGKDMWEYLNERKRNM